MTTPSHPKDPHASIFGSHPGGEGQLLGVGETSDAPARPTIRDVFDFDLGYIASVVRRLLGARRSADVPDAVSLALQEIHRSLPRFEPKRGPLRVWEYRIVERTTRKFARRGRSLASRMVSWGDLDMEGAVTGTEELMSTNELRRLWDELSLRMSEEQRDLLELHVMCGLSGPEIAALKGLNGNTTRKRLTLAKAELAALHREWQAKQARAGALVLPLSFGAWADHVQETAQYIPEGMRAQLLERLGLEAGRETGQDGPRGRATRLAFTGASVGGGLLGAFVFVLALLVVLVVVVLALLRRAPPPPPAGAAGGATASNSATALVATAAALPAAPLAAPTPATNNSAAVAPTFAHGPAPRTQRRSIVSAFERAMRDHGYEEACAKLRDYDAHHFAGADADADRAIMAGRLKAAGACDDSR